MLAAGLLRLGSILRFVSNAVMVGFLSAVGVNIVLGQLANFTGYQAQGSNRVVRAFDTLLHPAQLHLQTLAIGATTIALILLLERTRLGALALVVATIVASAAAAALGWVDVATLNDLTVVPRSLPLPQAPTLRLAPQLVVPALSRARQVDGPVHAYMAAVQAWRRLARGSSQSGATSVMALQSC